MIRHSLSSVAVAAFTVALFVPPGARGAGGAPLSPPAVAPPSGVPELIEPRSFRKAAPIQLATGSGRNRFRIHPGGEDEPPRGPRSFAVSPEGRIFILDNENSRLAVVDPTGRLRRSVRLPGARHFTGLVHLGSHKLVAYDSRRERLVLFDERGKHLRRLNRVLPGVPVVRIHRLGKNRIAVESFRRAFSVDLSNPSRARIRRHEDHQLPVKSGGFVRAVTTPGGAGTLRVLKGQAEKEIQIAPAVQGSLGSVSLLGSDKSGRLFARVEVITSMNPIRVRRFLHVYSADLQPIDSFEYPVDGLIIGDQDVDIDDNGNVHILLVHHERIVVQRFSPGTP
jgi:hypothetical protein